LKNGGLELDTEAKELRVDGELVKLTATEYGIVLFLMKNAGKVFSIDQIYENVWKEPAYSSENTVAVHIRRIREKIEINPKEPKYLKVVWGIGYKMEKNIKYSNITKVIVIFLAWLSFVCASESVFFVVTNGNTV